MEFRPANPVLQDAAALRAMAAEQGYLFVRGLLPRPVVEAGRLDILAEAAAQGWLDEAAPLGEGIARRGATTLAYDDPQFTALQAAVQARLPFDALRRHPALLALLERLFDGPVEAGCGDVCRLAFPASPERTTPPHQDQFFLKTDRETWTAWIPVGDCPRDLGAIQLLPGSHRRGLKPHGAGVSGMTLDADAEWASGDFACGDVLLFHYLTVHSARHNRDPRRVRVSVDCRYRRRGEKGEG